jgi:hypothetical protein
MVQPNGEKMWHFHTSAKSVATGAWMAPLSGSGIVRGFTLGVQTEVEFWDIAIEAKEVRVQLFVSEKLPTGGHIGAEALAGLASGGAIPQIFNERKKKR